MTDAIDLTKEQRKTLLVLLRRFIPGVAVWAYGSRVKWTARPNSDLDLVAFATSAQRPQVAELKDALAESNLPFPVDLHVWDEVPERFREIIRKEYVVVQEVKRPESETAKLGGWRSSNWGNEISLEYGKALRNYDVAHGKYRVFGSNGPVGWTDHPLAPAPGIILGRKGAYRGVQYSPDPFFVIDTAYYVVPKTELDMRWLYYAIKHYKLGEIDDGSPIPSTTRAAVYVQDIEVPPPDEQRAIAHILGTLDDKIELNRRMNETLEATARALFKSWFVDFDPVRAKSEGRDPGLPKALADLFPDSFEDSELGEIPKGWETGSLDSVLVLQRGFDLPATQRTPGTYPVLAASGPSGTHNEYMVRGPGVTTGRSGVLGKVFYVDDNFWPLNTSLWIKEFRHSRPAYAFHLLLRIDFALFNAGSAVPTLNRNHVHHLPTLLPPMALIDVFERIANGSLQRQKYSNQQSNTLVALRDTLLPKLISGELRVKDAERTVRYPTT